MKKGFTLIELLIVFVIISILSVIFIMTFQKYIQNSKCTVNKNQHDTIVGIVETTFAMCDVQGWTYPSDLLSWKPVKAEPLLF